MNPTKLLEKAKGTYIIIFKRPGDGKYFPLPDPGLNKPWSVTNFRLADKMCQDVKRDLGCEATVMTLEQGFNFLLNQDPEMGQKLYNQIVPKTS